MFKAGTRLLGNEWIALAIFFLRLSFSFAPGEFTEGSNRELSVEEIGADSSRAHAIEIWNRGSLWNSFWRRSCNVGWMEFESTSI